MILCYQKISSRDFLIDDDAWDQGYQINIAMYIEL